MDSDVTRREVVIDTPICLRRTAGREVLLAEPKTERSPGTGQARAEQEAIGVDYLDVMQRDGAVRLSSPSGLVLARAGHMLASGPDITEVSVGDFLSPLGSYASGRLFSRAVLAALGAGIIKPDVWEDFSLRKAQAAHAALEGGSSAGAIPPSLNAQASATAFVNDSQQKRGVLWTTNLSTRMRRSSRN